MANEADQQKLQKRLDRAREDLGTLIHIQSIIGNAAFQGQHHEVAGRCLHKLERLIAPAQRKVDELSALVTPHEVVVDGNYDEGSK